MKVYTSRSSKKIVTLFIIALIASLFFAAREKSMSLLFVILFIATVVIYIFYKTVYIVDNDKLIVKSSFLFDETVDISSITKIISRRKNLLSGPGFSSHRIGIFYGKHDCVFISPKDQESLIQDLVKVNPAIEVE